jgi:hypothetical protein
MGIPDSCIISPCGVPDELSCAICCCTILEPVQTQTNRLFCKPCIVQALAATPTCPTTRRPLNANQVQALETANPVVYRIWGRIKVRCANTGCSWTGDASDFKIHHDQCRVNASQGLAHQIEILQTELRREKEAASVLRQEIQTERAASSRLRQEISVHVESKAQLQSMMSVLQRDLEHLENISEQWDLKQKVDRTYSYGRDRVCELATVIANSLESKPANIDSNRIFDCIINIYRDWERGYVDNPKFLYMNAYMLLAVCRASTWFSERQQKRILEMIKNMHVQL